MSTKTATTRNYNSVFNWIWGRKPLCRGESDFIRHREDFIALGDEQEGGWFDAIVEDALGYMPRRLAQVDNSLVALKGKAMASESLMSEIGYIHPP